MMKEEILDKLKQFLHFNRLKFVYLYGSSVTGNTTDRSDIDICLYYDVNDKKELSELFFTISGSFPDKYDIQMFQFLPLYVKKEIFKGELIYADDKEFIHDVAHRTIEEYNDFEPRYKYILYGKTGVEGATL
ncbi:MAG: nucleotidyltransferase domain-containing protein [Candidatus Thermoplasmatota archaeon]|nr:nucleotidyltransferase domain-containing protein [Candidatus Thermoplasmatota archaeon]